MKNDVDVDADAGGLLESALSYAARGWSIIPVKFDDGRKRGAVRWKRYQDIAPGVTLLKRWFSSGKYPALGVILGPSSRNLACRDFDEAEAFEVWAESHPDLAASLPTVRTRRGFHVYFRAPVGKTVQYVDGELRGAKSLCVLPPSPHPKGGQYEWVNPPPDGPMPAVDPEAAGMVGESMQQKRTEERRSKPTQTEASICKQIAKGAGAAGEDEVELAIAATLPTGPRQRNQLVLHLARALKGIASLRELPGQALRSIVRRWHDRALPFITSKDFEETWIDFLYVWPKVRKPMRINLLGNALREARRRRVPGCTYEKPELQDLVALCRELQRLVGPEEPFFLSSWTAGKLFGVYPTTAWRWLFLLEQEGWIKTALKGNRNRATRFHYVGDRREGGPSRR